MRLLISKAVLCISILFLLGGGVYASVDFIITPNGSLLGPAINFTDINDAQNKIKEHPDNLLNNNNEVIPYGLALSNTIGYPNGKSIIKNYEGGLATGAAVYKYDRAENFSKDDPKIPGGGANAAVHFGFGLSGDTDITFKLFINQAMFTPDMDIEKESDTRNYNFSLDETNIVSLGVKGRYNLISEKELIPYVFKFGGVTAGVALDYLHGRVICTGSYQDTRLINFTGINLISGESFTQDVNIETTVNGKADFEWNVVSVTPEIMIYSDFFYFLTLYTGPAVSLNAGSANFNMTAEGILKNLTSVYGDETSTIEVAPADSTIATAVLRANVPFSVPLAVPLWKVGVEINMLAFKIQVEGAAVLTSPTKSFTAQAGVRFQF